MKLKFYLISFAILINLGSYSQTGKVTVSIIDGIPDKQLQARIEQNSSIILSSLNDAYRKNLEKPLLDSNVLSPDGDEKLNDLWSEGHFRCASIRIAEVAVQRGDIFQIRNIPIIYGDSDRFDVVMEFNTEGKVSDFYIALEAHQYKSVLDATSVIDRTRREIILGFLENLRTAYVKKDIEYIEKLYSDKALIITGKVLKTDNTSTDSYQKSLTTDQIKYQVLTKGEYIDKLKKVFFGISYLKLDFKDIEVVKHRKHPDFYGIRLLQIWDTSIYKDDGLLFLLVQFKDNEDPIIWVRTWQDATKTTIDDAFGLHNFKIANTTVQ